MDLYANDQFVENNQDARTRFLASVPYLISTTTNDSPTIDFTLDEVHTALRDMPSDKAAGHDSIPKEVIQELWNYVGKDLLEFILESLDQGQIPDSFKYGLTSLIPKEGTLTSNRNFRPILVLPATYKLIAKTLANRVQPVLPDSLQPTQTAFVKERNILDNVKQSKQSTIILLLDFEKAYDRVNWSFLEASMAKLGFSYKQILWTLALYRDAKTFFFSKQ